MPATLSTTNRSPRYQEGSIERVQRAQGPDVWVYRWRELDDDGLRVQRKRTIGNVHQFPTKSDAKREVENLRAEVNAQQDLRPRMTVGDAWGHFQNHELHDPEVGRSQTTIDGYMDYFKCRILPEWMDVPLEEVKAVRVEKWLRSLDLANGSKAKIRNHLSALFSHCIRHELYDKLNPIASVRQSSIRERDPDILTLDEIKSLIAQITTEAIRVMVAVAATTALRRSEIRGLKWSDLDFSGLWIGVKRGVVRKTQTKLKTKASRKGVPMPDDLAELLIEWRKRTPYAADTDWVFASPFSDGEQPYWAESALKDHVQPAAHAAGITKHVTWHTFRHSLGSYLGQSGEQVKVVQELLRHASIRITQDVYQQADQTAKREALKRFSGLFVVPNTKSA
jgi:integrase